MCFYQQEAPNASMGPPERQQGLNGGSGLPHCVSPLEGLSTFSRVWLKDLCSKILGLMDQVTKALKEENSLGSKSSDNQGYLVYG